jgi:hypothetical protein
MRGIGGEHSRPTPAMCRNNSASHSRRPVLLLVAMLIAQNAKLSHGGQEGGLQDRLEQVKDVRCSSSEQNCSQASARLQTLRARVAIRI